MGMDSSVDAPSPPSQSQYQIGHPRHFYLAVDRSQFKMQTLVDLLDLVGRRSCLPIVVCCSTRDDLDSLCSSLSSLPFISFSALYSDLSEDERAFVLEKFSQVATRWHQSNHAGAGNGDDVGKDDRSHMVIVTDACLPLLTSGESPMNAHLLINYELPAKKETYGRRLGACLTSDGIVINMVVGGEVVTLKSIEESTSILMQEMPMQKEWGEFLHLGLMALQHGCPHLHQTCKLWTTNLQTAITYSGGVLKRRLLKIHENMKKNW